MGGGGCLLTTTDGNHLLSCEGTFHGGKARQISGRDKDSFCRLVLVIIQLLASSSHRCLRYTLPLRSLQVAGEGRYHL